MAVVENLRLGLDRAGVAYRMNPGRRVTPNLGVLSDGDTLAWAVGLRRRGRIRRLVAGPNFPHPSFDHRILDPAIDIVLVASEWVRDLYVAHSPELRERSRVWPVGIDERWWTPDTEHKALDVLVYSKAHPPELLDAVARTLAEAGLTATVVRYGEVGRERFRDLLRRHRWALFLSENEGQGIALLEAWSCDVPTLAWDPGTWVQLDRRWDRASAAPYLSPRTGASFRSAGDLPAAVSAMEEQRFTPREEVLERFTAERCAREYAALFEA